MKPKEAFEILRDTPIDIRSAREDDIHILYATAQNMALDALKELQHYKDLEEQGRLIEVIRCKDCLYEQHCKNAQYLGIDGYCSHAEFVELKGE